MLSAYTNTKPDLTMAFAADFDLPLERRLLDTDQAAEFLQVSPRQVQRLAQAGTLPYVKVGKLYRFRLTSLEGWAEETEIGA